jgi:8-oxo-dGTP pyrophosphatase MutT (NUDIX family)
MDARMSEKGLAPPPPRTKPGGAVLCNNCHKPGHMQHNCKMPIVSAGIIAFRCRQGRGELEFLMICRKDTLGFVDFMRGKYIAQNKGYIQNMIYQMTAYEKEKLRRWTFDALWRDLWHGDVDTTGVAHLRAPLNHRNNSVPPPYNSNDTYYQKGGSSNATCSKKRGLCGNRHNDEYKVRDRFEALVYGMRSREGPYNLNSLVEESLDSDSPVFTEPEWGFPKGRQNASEMELDCALREFEEETGIPSHLLRVVQNIAPLQEIFTGSNYKSYTHKYYLAMMGECEGEGGSSKEGEDDQNKQSASPIFQRTEVSKLDWFTYDECVRCIRPYNSEKLRVMNNVKSILNAFNLR